VGLSLILPPPSWPGEFTSQASRPRGLLDWITSPSIPPFLQMFQSPTGLTTLALNSCRAACHLLVRAPHQTCIHTASAEPRRPLMVSKHIAHVSTPDHASMLSIQFQAISCLSTGQPPLLQPLSLHPAFCAKSVFCGAFQPAPLG